MGEILSPKIDLVFRKLYGSEENKEFLISLINSVEPDLKVVDIEIKNPYNLGDYKDSKVSIVDIKAKSSNGDWFNIEMQIIRQALYGIRALYYAAKLYADQLAAGDKLTKLTRAIGIHFIDFNFFDDTRFLRQFVFKDKETNEEHAQLGAIRIYFLEMNKARKEWSEVKTNLDRWLAILNEAENLDPATLPEALSSDPVIVRAVAKLERMGFDANERELYETEVKARMVELEEREEIMKQGIEQGMQAGKERLVLRLISRRIGDVPDDLAEMLDRLSADELDEFGEALLDFNSFVDVRAWLSSH